MTMRLGANRPAMWRKQDQLVAIASNSRRALAGGAPASPSRSLPLPGRGLLPAAQTSRPHDAWASTLDWGGGREAPGRAEQADLNRKMMLTAAVLAAGASGCSSAGSHQTAQPATSNPAATSSAPDSAVTPVTTSRSPRGAASLPVPAEPRARRRPL